MKKIISIIILSVIIAYSFAQDQTINGNLHVSSNNGGTLRIGKIGNGGNISVPFQTETNRYNIDFTGYRDISPDQVGARISAIRFNNYGSNTAYVQNTALAFYTNPSGLNPGSSDLIERMRISPEGNVGIGTNKPKSKLDVGDLSENTTKSILARLEEGSSEGDGTYLGVKSYYTQIVPGVNSFNNVKSFAIEHKFYGLANSSIDFYRGDGKQGGSIGISVDNGSQLCKFSSRLLDVAGTIRAREVKIEVNAGADHVFAEDYALKPLSEVESFVKENKHLPEIPSEKQMQEEGLSVNEFQIKLLQKIEELTLYVIQQQSEINELKEKLDK